MEASRGTAYGLGLSQCAITLGFVLFFPSVQVDVYSAHGGLTGGGLANRTAARLLVLSPTVTRVFMGMPVLAASGLAAVFATVTYKVHTDSLSGQDFQPDVVEQMGMWDTLFWAYCVLSHAIVACIVCDPVDVFGIISSASFMGYFLCRACYPKGQDVNLTRENLNILGYGLGVLQLAYQLTSTRNNGMSVLMLVVVMDYFLGIGHTYDRQATIDTVSNCRLFYICAGTVGTALLYAMSAEPDGPGFAGGSDVFLT
jgi:hypothetical protein